MNYNELWISGQVTGDGIIIIIHRCELNKILWRPVSLDLTAPLSTNIYGCL